MAVLAALGLPLMTASTLTAVEEGREDIQGTAARGEPAVSMRAMALGVVVAGVSYSATATEVNGIWSRTITVIDLTPEEIAAAKKASVPQVVTRKQARRALSIAGLLPLVQPAIDAIEPLELRALAQIDWDDALEFRRDDETLTMLAAALGLDEEALDDLFILAGGQP